MKYRHSDVPSLIQGDVPEEEANCYICHKSPCDFHHLLSSNKYKRRFAETAGAWVWLCRGHHRYIHDTSAGQQLWREWKKQAQMKYEETHSREEWMKGSHKNYE